MTETPTCKKCGKPAVRRGGPCAEHRCGAANKRFAEGQTGEFCDRWPIDGAKRCRTHGSGAKHARAAAARKVAEEKAAGLVRTYGLKVDTTPTEALLDEVQWTAGHVAWLRQRVQDIETGDGDAPTALVWGTTRRKTGGDDWGETEEAKPNPWIALYQQERTHLLKVCAAAISAGIEERRVKLAEHQGALVAQAIRAILGDLDLTVDQQAKVSEIVPRHLRALAS